MMTLACSLSELVEWIQESSKRDYVLRCVWPPRQLLAIAEWPCTSMCGGHLHFKIGITEDATALDGPTAAEVRQNHEGGSERRQSKTQMCMSIAETHATHDCMQHL